MFDPGEMRCHSSVVGMGLAWRAASSSRFAPAFLPQTVSSVGAGAGFEREDFSLGWGSLSPTRVRRRPFLLPLSAAATARPEVPEPRLRRLLVRLLADAPEDGAPPLRSALLRVAATRE